MIQSLTIRDVATYSATGSTLLDLKEINFLFGANASGKTTVSRVIANPDLYPRCGITWHANAPIDRLVYNLDFRERHFKEFGQLKGVFTLGEDNATLLAQIESKRTQINRKTESINDRRAVLDGNATVKGKRAELAELMSSFAETCWNQKLKHEGVFRQAFTGSTGSKDQFRDKIISESTRNQAAAASLEELTTRASSVFAIAPVREAEFGLPNFDDLEGHETNTILARSVVGSADVPIAKLIQTLGSGDWVNRGRQYFRNSAGACPFCQQEAPTDLERLLNDFFDESYSSDCRTISTLLEAYERDGARVQDAINRILEASSNRINTPILRNYADAIDAIISENIEHLRRKQREPSAVVELKPIAPQRINVLAILENANASIRSHNARIDNLQAERQSLTSQVWRYLIDAELSESLRNFTQQKHGIDSAIAGLSQSIRTAESEREALAQELRDCERRTTSIRPTMDAINGLLASFGFTMFRLAESATPNMYELQRPDGTPVQTTLSEGERTFLTFLYFYYLIRGSESETGTTTRKVVVIDDPVSSLDSEVLFVVSSLVKKVLQLAREEDSHVAQVFVLTHNIYFHKEVTFHAKRVAGNAFAEETFWIVRRKGVISEFQQFRVNPIKSSYEMLWSELRSANPSPGTICNTMRRILEHYFKLLGEINLDSLEEGFVGDDKLVCRSLVSWIHDGSHVVMDGLHYSTTETTVEKYLDVFRRVFENQKHESHYRMMMGDSYVPRASASQVPGGVATR